MSSSANRAPLNCVLVGTAVFGLVLVLLPHMAHPGFGLQMFGDSQRILRFAPEALGYVTLMQGVLGATSTALQLVGLMGERL